MIARWIERACSGWTRLFRRPGEAHLAEELNAIMGAAPAGIFVAHDRDCHHITGNERAYEILGLPAGQNLSASPRSGQPLPGYRVRIRGKDAASPELPMQAAVCSGLPVRDVEMEIVRADGSVRTVLMNAAPLRRPGGSVRGAVGVLIDITERKRVEEAVRVSEDRFREAFQHAPIGMVLLDLSGRFQHVNPAYCRLVGYEEHELLSPEFDMLRLTHPDDLGPHVEAMERLTAGVVPSFFFEKRNIRRDGSIAWVRVSATVRRDGAGRPFQLVGLVEDISDRKRAEEDLLRAKQAAEEANSAKDHFLAVLSHELRTPLTPVLACVSMVEREEGMDEDLRQMLCMIRRNVEMEARLIDDLLDVTRITRGKIELSRQRIAVEDVLNRAVEVCRPDIELRGLHLGMSHQSPRPTWVDADSARLQQVFWNLLKNAIKFTGPGGCIGVRSRVDRDQALIEIIDSGEGIEPEALQRIFHAFEQAGASARQYGGLGLGLAISRAIVEMHGGTIAAHSAGKGQGALFTVRLPLAIRGDADPAKGKLPEEHPGEPRQERKRPLRILMVEDHPDTARVMSRLLAAQGHAVRTAATMADACSAAMAESFDLILSDLGLPDGSGIDFMRSVRGRGIDTPGIALSGYGQEEDLRRSREAGFNAHLTKPVDIDRLKAAIDDVAALANGSRRA